MLIISIFIVNVFRSIEITAYSISNKEEEGNYKHSHNNINNGLCHMFNKINWLIDIDIDIDMYNQC